MLFLVAEWNWRAQMEADERLKESEAAFARFTKSNISCVLCTDGQKNTRMCGSRKTRREKFTCDGQVCGFTTRSKYVTNEILTFILLNTICSKCCCSEYSYYTGKEKTRTRNTVYLNKVLIQIAKQPLL